MNSGIPKYLINGLLTAAAGRATGILKAELESAKQELAKKAKGLGIGIGFVVAASSFMGVAFAILVTAGVLGLATVWPAWLAALVIGGGVLLVGLILVAIGAGLINKNKDLKPEKAINNLRAYLGQ